MTTRINRSRFHGVFCRLMVAATSSLLAACSGDFAAPVLEKEASASAALFGPAGATKPGHSFMWSEQAKLLAPDGAADELFGYTTSLSGDTAFVGAYSKKVGANPQQGAVYVFARTGGAWTYKQTLVASDGGSYHTFGSTIAVEGDTAIIGAREASFGGNMYIGAAYVFTRSNGVWAQTQKLSASDGAAGDRFGYSVAISGDTVVVGADNKNVGSVDNRGAAYVFTRTAGVWTQQQRLLSNDNPPSGLFGISVALSADTAVVGASYIGGGAPTVGAAYVFTRSAGAWTQEQKLGPADGLAGDNFASTVALSGNTALLGASNDTTGAETNQGSAYVFSRNAGVWTQQQKLMASDGAGYDFFGFWLDLEGDTALIGRSNAEIGANTDQGAAYVFTRNGSVWTEQKRLTASDGAMADHLGTGVSLDGNTALVGAGLATISGNYGQGKAYLFVLANALGEGCATDAECLSGFCVDGVCCNSACGGGDMNDCQACSKASGAATDGTCAPLIAGTECRGAAGVCDMPEACDGATSDCPADQNLPDGTTCPDGVCLSGVCLSQMGTGGAGGAGGAGGVGGTGGAGGAGGAGGIGGAGGAAMGGFGGSGGAAMGGFGGAETGGGETPGAEGGCNCNAAGSTPSNTLFAPLSLVALVLLRLRKTRER